MLTYCPEVTILRGKRNTSFTEGSDKEVRLGAAKLEVLIKKMFEKRVKLPANLITFIKSSHAVSKYWTHFQSLRNPVSIEVGSDLVLSSLSSDALDKALAIVVGDLSVEYVKLQRAAVVPPNFERMKELLMKAKTKENHHEVRVDISFIPGPSGSAVTKVRLVGYTENVKKLSEVLNDFQMNQLVTQEAVKLPHPEMVDCFNKILELTGMKQTKVTLKASHVPYPCVLVIGPRCLVQEAKQALMSALTNLALDTLTLDGPGARRYFQAEGRVSKELLENSCRIIIREKQAVGALNVNTRRHASSHVTITTQSSITKWHSKILPGVEVNKTSLEIKVGSLVDEQVKVLVVPMLSGELMSTEIGQCLLRKAGNAIRRNFDLIVAKSALAPGDVLQVDGPPSISCSKIFFIECLQWDGVRGHSVQALGNGLKRCLDLCVQKGLCSVALPVIGPGLALKYPWREAFKVLTEKIFQFGSSATSRSLSIIRIVIKPDPESEKYYHDFYRHLNLNMTQGGQAIFRCLTSDLDEFTMTVASGLKLQVVFGDITSETTDAVVNTTNFTDFQGEVCKSILSVAGPHVEAILKKAKVNRGAVFVTPPGSFPCKAILHVCGENDSGIVEQLVCRIIQHCESTGYKSVAIPAICAGADGLDPDLVVHPILQGIKSAKSATSLLRLTTIRLVLNKINLFLTFKQQIRQMFPAAVVNTVLAKQLLHVQRPQVSVNSHLSILCATGQHSVFLFLGLDRKDVNDGMTNLKKLYQAHCSMKEITKEDLADLTEDEIKDIQKLVETHGLHVQEDLPEKGGLIVSGLKDGVTDLMQRLHSITCLRKEMRIREEDVLYTCVMWCILGPDGSWERLPKTANHNLEKHNIMKGIEDKWGSLWSVDLQKMEVRRHLNGQKTKLKRLENRPDFTLPLYWDKMDSDENVKVVALEPSSVEYLTIKKSFTQTVQKTVMKIERLQNVHLRQGYEVQKRKLSEKNRQVGGEGEKLLFHGTSRDNCDSIIKHGFNRSFSGKNATVFGHGTYFAVNASYSASPTYSKPATDGSQTVFVAQVLTGTYTQGRSDMKMPPLRNNQADDRYDSVVDRIDKPNMFVVFSDNQAYPEYLITFY